MNNFSTIQRSQYRNEFANGVTVSKVTLLGSVGIFDMPHQKKKNIGLVEKIRKAFANIFCRSKKTKKYALPVVRSGEIQQRKNRYLHNGYYRERIPDLLDYLLKNENQIVHREKTSSANGESEEYYTGGQILKGLKAVYVDGKNSKYVVDNFMFDKESYSLRVWGFTGRNGLGREFHEQMKEDIEELHRFKELDKWFSRKGLDQSGIPVEALIHASRADRRIKDLLQALHSQIKSKNAWASGSKENLEIMLRAIVSLEETYMKEYENILARRKYQTPEEKAGNVVNDLLEALNAI